jgi:antitoxin ParD1/3/4
MDVGFFMSRTASLTRHPLKRILTAYQETCRMVVKASVSISPEQDAFVRKLVEDGEVSSVSEAVQQGLELLREQSEAKEADTEALRKLIDERLKGEFVTLEESNRQIAEMIARKRASYGL